MEDELDTLNLQELAERSGIGSRTIRSYIEKDLLPGAEPRGPSSYYTAAHLDRLLAIRRLRHDQPDASLAEIRRILLELTEEQIRNVAAGQFKNLNITRRDRSESALDYLAALKKRSADVVSSQPASKWKARDSSPQIAADQTIVEQLAEFLRRAVGTNLSPVTTRREGWYRFEITPDVELSVRGGFSEEQLALFQEITGLLRLALTRGIKGPDSS
jgi:DNA-binding transcriptional MerR regulator